MYEQRLWRNMPLTFDVLNVLYCLCVIYIYGLFSVLLVWHTIRQYILHCTNRYILNSLLIFSTSNELQPHSRSLLAHSMANITLINDNFLQDISLFMFQEEWKINLNNLFTFYPCLDLDKPTVKHSG